MITPMLSLIRSACPGCGAPNNCAIESGKSASACWCMGEKRVFSVEDEEESCYCSLCLKSKIKAKDNDVA